MIMGHREGQTGPKDRQRVSVDDFVKGQVVVQCVGPIWHNDEAAQKANAWLKTNEVGLGTHEWMFSGHWHSENGTSYCQFQRVRASICVGPIWGQHEADQKVQKFMERSGHCFDLTWTGEWSSEDGTSYAQFFRPVPVDIIFSFASEDIKRVEGISNTLFKAGKTCHYYNGKSEHMSSLKWWIEWEAQCRVAQVGCMFKTTTYLRKLQDDPGGACAREVKNIEKREGPRHKFSFDAEHLSDNQCAPKILAMLG